MRKAKCAVGGVQSELSWTTTHPDDSGYHENQVAVGEIDEVYQDDELSCSFNIDPNLTLNSLLSDANDVTVLEQWKQDLRKKETWDIERSLYFILCSFYFLLRSLYFILCFWWILTCACFEQNVEKVEECHEEDLWRKE
jgi:hypothetical protein